MGRAGLGLASWSNFSGPWDIGTVPSWLIREGSSWLGEPGNESGWGAGSGLAGFI